MANRLASETSPYLLQHKDNPVDWWPWSEAAFAEARRRDVPVFLSVGYSTCYWCHVMERECFEDADIARQMNEQFVNVKVDREERPDVDEHYMTATQVLTGQGGWPMSVFMTPDAEPFYAGTYLPPRDMHGRPGFPTLMRAISQAWRQRRAEILQGTGDLRNILQQLARPKPPEQDIAFDDSLLSSLLRRSAEDFDPRHGGFGSAPKFPRQTLLELLLVAGDAFEKELRRTLDAMADGGIRDHLGGGFHRYSTDARWLVPHFEIMLYDQATLAWCYAEASRRFDSPRYARVARGVCDFVLREMTDPAGGFYTAIDAEAEAREGGPYLWTAGEVEQVLGAEDAAKFNRLYGLDKGPNFADPHAGDGTPDRNVLYLPEGPDSGDLREDDPAIDGMRQKLLESRRKRPQPLLDTKILTSWNGLMIRGLAHAGAVLGEERYIRAASRAADWLLHHHRTADGALLRSSRDGQPKPTAGFLDDYAHFARGLISLRHASGNEAYRDHARDIAAQMNRRFADDADGGYFIADTTADELGAMTRVRRKVAGDTPLPSGNGSAALAMLELGEAQRCRRVLETFAGQLVDHAQSMSTLLEAGVTYVRREGLFTVRGRAGAGGMGGVDAGPGATIAAGPDEEARDAVDVDAVWLDERRLEVRLRIAEPFHLTAPSSVTGDHRQPDEGAGGAAGSPVELHLTGPAAEALEAVEFPPAPGGVYEGQIAVQVRFARSIRRGNGDVVVQYQPCDETRCLKPVRKRLAIGE